MTTPTHSDTTTLADTTALAETLADGPADVAATVPTLLAVAALMARGTELSDREDAAGVEQLSGEPASSDVFFNAMMIAISAVPEGFRYSVPGICRSCGASHFGGRSNQLGVYSWAEPDLCTACEETRWLAAAGTTTTAGRISPGSETTTDQTHTATPIRARATDDADRQLLALAARMRDLMRERDQPPITDDKTDRTNSRIDRLEFQIAELPAHTVEGMLVKAEIAADMAMQDTTCSDEANAVSLVRDLRRLAGAAAAT